MGNNKININRSTYFTALDAGFVVVVVVIDRKFNVSFYLKNNIYVYVPWTHSRTVAQPHDVNLFKEDFDEFYKFST